MKQLTARTLVPQFGELLPGASQPATLTLTSIGNADALQATLSVEHLDGTTVEAMPIALPAGQSSQVMVLNRAPALAPRRAGETEPEYIARLHTPRKWLPRAHCTAVRAQAVAVKPA